MGPALTSPDLKISLRKVDKVLGLVVSSASLGESRFLKLGPAELVSHTEGRLMNNLRIPGLKTFASMQFNLIDPEGREELSHLFLHISVLQDLGLDKIYIVSPGPRVTMTDASLPQDRYFNAAGELLDFTIVAPLQVSYGDYDIRKYLN